MAVMEARVCEDCRDRGLQTWGFEQRFTAGAEHVEQPLGPPGVGFGRGGE